MSAPVSVLIVVRNEARHILSCIRSVEAQFQPGDDWELILVDGMSSDGGRELAEEYLQNADFAYKILDNEKKTLAPGWNIGIRHARGKYVVRPDAHATLHLGYISSGIDTLEAMPDVAAVGGVLETRSRGFWGNIIRMALSSRVGVGNSSFRTSAVSGYADTAVYAVYRKEIFEKAGYFDENLVRHQDNEMHLRIKKAGGRFFLNTGMKADYYCRDSLRGIARQMFNIGRYLPDVMFKGALGMRHLMPFAFFGAAAFFILIGALFIPGLFYAGWSMLSIYFLVILLEAVRRSVAARDPGMVLLLLVIPVIHLSYAWGTFIGLVLMPWKRRD